MNPFLNALPVIANALADTLGVEVVLNAGSARTNGKKIFLPSLAGDDPESITLGLGYVAHEGGHCRFSDMSAEFFGQFVSPLEKHVSNLFEDIFIEKAMAQVFPGVKIYLADMVEVLVGKKFFAESPVDATPMQLMLSFMLCRLRADLLEQPGIATLADVAESRAKEIIPAGMMTKLEAMMFRVDECKNSQDVLDLTRAIIKMMEDEAKKEAENEKPESDDEAQNSEPSDDRDGDGSDDSSEQDEDQQTPDDSKSETGQQDGDDDQSGPTASKIIQSILSAGDDEGITTTDDALKEALGDVQNTSTSSNVAPFKLKPYPHADAPMVNIDAEKNRVAAASNALRARTQSLLQAQTQAVKRSSSMGTKLNVKNLHRARLDGQVFQKTKEGIKIDTAIAILVDRSGSMVEHGKIALAMDATLAATMAFDRPGVKTAVYAFPYCHGEDSNVLLKHWDAQPASAIPTYLNIGVDGYTPLAEALMGVGMDLMKRPEARKILLVATDGEPDGVAESKWVIDLARKSGMEVIAIGIMDDATIVFGQQWANNIKNIDQLPTAMIGMLENIMLKRN